ncbi:MAG: hypothetical protein JWO62_3359, partial [Acidimicrobiaceae bacterium]|nr:hypothetical protein [Acidimicrobiaceae bacterium]
MTPDPSITTALEALEGAEQAMSPGPWFVHDPEGDASIWTMPDASPDMVDDEQLTAWMDSGTHVANTQLQSDPLADARGIAALRTAAPALLAVVRAAAAWSESRGSHEIAISEHVRRGYALTEALAALA